MCNLDILSKLQAPSSKLPSSKLQAPSSKLQAPSSKLQAPSSKLQAPSSKLIYNKNLSIKNTYLINNILSFVIAKILINKNLINILFMEKNMKKLFTSLIIFLTLLLIVSCSNGSTDPNNNNNNNNSQSFTGNFTFGVFGQASALTINEDGSIYMNVENGLLTIKKKWLQKYPIHSTI